MNCIMNSTVSNKIKIKLLESSFLKPYFQREIDRIKSSEKESMEDLTLEGKSLWGPGEVLRMGRIDFQRVVSAALRSGRQCGREERMCETRRAEWELTYKGYK